jgi:hypothetical protein
LPAQSFLVAKHPWLIDVVSKLLRREKVVNRNFEWLETGGWGLEQEEGTRLFRAPIGFDEQRDDATV